MPTRLRLPAFAAGAALLAAAPTAAFAGTASSTMSVTATVTANCTVSTTALAFGNVNTISGSNCRLHRQPVDHLHQRHRLGGVGGRWLGSAAPATPTAR